MATILRKRRTFSPQHRQREARGRRVTPSEGREGTAPHGGQEADSICRAADAIGNAVILAWHESRRHDELTSLLTGFKGVLQSDAYGAYASHERKHEDIVRVGCWAHARRYFHEALERHRKPAELILRLIGRLYVSVQLSRRPSRLVAVK